MLLGVLGCGCYQVLSDKLYNNRVAVFIQREETNTVALALPVKYEFEIIIICNCFFNLL